MTDEVEAQITEWRAYVSRSPAVDDGDVEELEAHLRDQIAELREAGLSGDEAVLVAVKRMGALNGLSREFAREHRGRLWKQLVLGGGDEQVTDAAAWRPMVAFTLAAAVTVHLVRLAAGFPEEVADWLPRNAALFVLPFLAGYFAVRRRLSARQWLLAATPFVVAGLLVNLYPWQPDSNTELLVAAHLPVLLWFALAHPYTGGSIRSSEARMDFVRFTGEWFIYYVLIALGGGVLMGLTMAILEPIGPDLAEQVVVWVLPAGVVGAVIVAAWLVEAKQQVVENMAPVLTMIFTPLFAVMLTVAAVTYAVSGVGGAFDRELLGIFDALLVVVLGLVLYAMSARDPMRPPGWMDRVQLVAVAAALLLDVMVLGAMIARIGDLGFTPNRTAALGLNLVLLANLAATAWLTLRFLRGQVTFHRLERWQTGYLPVFAGWAAVVVALLPLAFAFA